ncbi:hypothetical protein MNB_SV-6-1901 [hydrothermal vent metagenome]|uniref:Uncharacterized protein n=1 Tax=hydrothermal vent metagenome TaxID=652676 RepID=A0A1W1C507_9ZZZZ
MADTQMKRLVEMMHRESVSSYLDICIPALQVKRKHLNALSKGDVLPLNSKELRVEVLDGNHILAQGVYGVYQNSRSVLIEDQPTEIVDRLDKKKYETIRVHLGTIERSKYGSDKIVRLITDSRFDALLYRADDRLLAKAILVQIDGEMALEIGEIVE